MYSGNRKEAGMSYYYPAGMPSHLSYLSSSVPEILISAAHNYGSRIAIVDGQDTLSYLALLDNAKSVASELSKSGIGQGDVVAIHMPNSLHFYTAYFGALFTGAAVTLLNPLQPAPLLVDQLRQTRARALITHVNCLEQARFAINQLDFRRILIAKQTWATGTETSLVQSATEAVEDSRFTCFEKVIGTSSDFVPVIVDDGEVAQLAFTGGTTGLPKRVRILHRNVMANLTQMAAWRLHSMVRRDVKNQLQLDQIRELGQSQVEVGAASTVHVPPMFHAAGLTLGNFSIFGGVTLVIIGRFTPEKFVHLAKEWGVTFTSGNPPMYAAIAESCEELGTSIPSMKLAVSGAAPIDSTTLSRIGRIMPNAIVGEGYGLTEANAMVTSTPVQIGSLQKPGTVGIPICDTEVEIRGPGNLALVEDNQVGELWVRGPQVADGYDDADAETAEQFVNGWLRTGDIASRDSDGFIRIHERAKDMLIYNGYNVYPRELEDILAGHPSVAKVAVIGRPVENVGEIPTALVVPRSSIDFPVDQFLKWAAKQVLPYQRIRELYIVGDLPISPAGKVQKTNLKSLVADLTPVWSQPTRTRRQADDTLPGER